MNQEVTLSFTSNWNLVRQVSMVITKWTLSLTQPHKTDLMW